MLVNADVKSLEVYMAADWYDDKVLKEELLSPGYDMHANNQENFKLHARVIAKIFVFKLLYGASAYGYYTDPDFTSVGFSQKKWQEVIDAFYNKYKGIKAGHVRDLQKVKDSGYLEIFSGRYFNYKPVLRRGEWHWPLTTIKNYPIQGGGADLVKLARIKFYKDFKASGLEGEFISTIHDSLVVDTPEKNVYTIRDMLRNAIQAVPQLCVEHYNYAFSLPILCEVQAGPNKFDMKVI